MRRTVNEARAPSPRLRMTVPSKTCVRSFSPSITRSEEHTSELQSRLHLVCRPPRSALFPYTTLFRSLAATHAGAPHDFDAIDPRRVQRKRPLDADAVGDAPNGERGARAFTTLANDRAVEDLRALFLALDNQIGRAHV